jgi:hypothetical protein
MVKRVSDAGGSPVIIPVPTVGRIEEGLAEIIQLARDGEITAVMFSSMSVSACFSHRGAGDRSQASVRATAQRFRLPWGRYGNVINPY